MRKFFARHKFDPEVEKRERAKLPEILPLTSDVMFKILFGDERNKDILADFLTGVLGFEVKEDDITLLDPHLARDRADDKLGILDVKLKLASGKFVNIEMQVENLKDMRNRIEYYISTMTARQLKASGDYVELLPVVAIIVSKQNMLKETTRFHCEFGTLEKTEHFELHGLRAIHVLELSKLPNVSGKLENWLKFINSEKKENYMRLARKNPLMRKALRVLQLASSDPQTQEEFLYEKMARMDERARNAQREDDARAEGRAEGIVEGRVEGRAEGVAEGTLKGETKKALEIANTLKRMGLAVEQIAEATKLTENEIKNL